MKIIKYKFFNGILLFSIIFFCSCESFLEEDPRGQMSADQYFNNYNEALSAVYGAYSMFNAVGNPAYFTPVLVYNGVSMGTDIAFMPREVTGGMLHGVYDFSPNDSRMIEYWQMFYAGIKNNNLAISRISNSDIDENEKNTLIAEIMFVRAYTYYLLTTLFGDVPYWREELVIDEISVIGSTPREEIWISILQDLNVAEVELPVNTHGENGARATKWAAKMLKARIYLWQNNWLAAKTEAKEIISQSPHELLPNFGDIFRATNNNNKEVIFGTGGAVDLLTNLTTHQWRPHPTWETKVANPGWFDGVGGYCFFQSFVDKYSPEDIRKKYTVFDYYNETKLDFNWATKVLRAPIPVDDPLVEVAEPTRNSGLHDIYMRLADTYLVLAEAENELNGPTEEAYNALNEIRNRAGLDDIENLSQDEFRKEIQDERAKEFAGEVAAGRKQDLIRWGILIETVKKVPSNEILAQNANPQLTDKYRTKANYEAERAASLVQEKNNFFPIPQTEIDKNPNLKQNPLWE